MQFGRRISHWEIVLLAGPAICGFLTGDDSMSDSLAEAIAHKIVSRRELSEQEDLFFQLHRDEVFPRVVEIIIPEIASKLYYGQGLDEFEQDFYNNYIQRVNELVELLRASEHARPQTEYPGADLSFLERARREGVLKAIGSLGKRKRRRPGNGN